MQRNPHANEMRKNPTGAERLMWRHLRNRGLGGYKFRRQFPIGTYIADFACWEARLIIEVDGSQHMTRRDYDAERTAYLESQGFKVIRFWNGDVLKNIDGVLANVLQVLKQREIELKGGAAPHPGPLPEEKGR